MTLKQRLIGYFGGALLGIMIAAIFVGYVGIHVNAAYAQDAGIVEVQVPEPGAKLQVPDPVDNPGAAVRTVSDTYERFGIWSTILLSLFAIGKAVQKRNLHTHLGRWAPLLLAAFGLSGAWAEVLMTDTAWVVGLANSLFYLGMALNAAPKQE